MPIVLGNTTITGIGAGGLGSGVVNSTLLANSSVTRPKVNIPGTVLQVVSTTVTGTYEAVSNGSVLSPTGLNASITPTSTSSKILILCHIHYGCWQTTYKGWVRRNGTDIFLGDARGSRQRASTGLAFNTDTNQSNTHFYCFLDSPSSTSSLSYVYHVINDNSASFRLNYSQADGDASVGKRGTSSITLMEIQG